MYFWDVTFQKTFMKFIFTIKYIKKNWKIFLGCYIFKKSFEMIFRI